jgi:dipeptidyl aminopeptidase/acylaminoacyl peptidase
MWTRTGQWLACAMLCASATSAPIVSLTGDRTGTRHRADFDPTTQFFASRGYAVLQLNPRGSAGYGRRFREAAFKNWDSAVQNDIVDAIETLVRTDGIDRNRVAIYGTGFGGYVALLALTTSPELFRCGITYGGFADPQAIVHLRRIWTDSQTYRNMDVSRQRLVELLGSASDSAAQARSPLAHLDRIRVPLFVAHGAADSEVPFSEGMKLAEALKMKGADLSGYMPADEDHEFRLEGNRAELYRKLEAFLARSMGHVAPATKPSDSTTPTR